MAGKTVFLVRAAVMELPRAPGDLSGKPKLTSRPVNFYEKGDKLLEIVATCQWYLFNGGRDEQLKADLLKYSVELAWTPEHTRRRYSDWVGGLSGNWLASRRRFSGIPSLVWYPPDADGESLYDQMIVTDKTSLSVDPVTVYPPDYERSQHGIPGGSITDPDVADIWATSSLTPQIASGWGRDEELSSPIFPMGIVPQGHDIIRTRLFSRIMRTNLENHPLPWRHTIISGFVTDLDHKKMSRSKGNVAVPSNILERFGSDAVYWCATVVRPGMDSPFDQPQMEVGRRLVMKILNAGKFVLGLAPEPGDPVTVTNPVGRTLLAFLSDVVIVCMETFSAFDYARTLEVAETFLWFFCDNHLELTKERAYGSQGLEAQAFVRSVLAVALGVQLWLFASFLSFVTEGTWSWTHGSSIRRSPWPTVGGPAVDGGRQLLANIALVLIMIHDTKSNAEVSIETPVRKAAFPGDHVALERLKAIGANLRAVGHITGEAVRKIAEGSLIAEAELEEPLTT